MSHEVETMAFNGANGKPWWLGSGVQGNAIGVEVTGDMTPEEIAVAAGINWEVEKAPLFHEFNGEFHAYTDRFALRRTTDGKLFDIVSDVYNVIQPIQALGIFDRFVRNGSMTMETAGSLKGGEFIYGLASLGEGFTLAGGDRVEGYLMMHSPYKLGQKIRAKFTGVRVVCANTHAMALADGGGSWTMSHSRAFNEQAKADAEKTLGLAKDSLHHYAEAAEFLSTTKIDGQQQLIEYVATLTGSKLLEAAVESGEAIQNGSFLEAAIAHSESIQEVRKIRESDLNRVGRTVLESILKSPGSDLESSRGTWWGAVNGVTYAADHSFSRNNLDNRAASAWFGPRANLKDTALELAIQYAEGKVS